MIAVDNSLLSDVISIFIKKEPIVYNNNNNDELLKLIKYVQPPIRIGSFQMPDRRALSQSGGIMLSVEANNELELARKTKLKLILSKDKSNYPYINITNDEFESNYTATYSSNRSKIKVLEHIKCLIKEGDYIEIYDKYLLNDNGDSVNVNDSHHSVNIINQISSNLTTQQLKIFCKNNGNISDENDRINARKRNITYRHIQYVHNINNLNKHDRYIIIFEDNNIKYEIILSSGLYNILGNSDFTYVIRVF